MKVYVDELPKDCKSCLLCRSGHLKLNKKGRYVDAQCCVLGEYYKYFSIDDEIDTCPLQQLPKDNKWEKLKNYLFEEQQTLKEMINPFDFDEEQEAMKSEYNTFNAVKRKMLELEKENVNG